MKLYTEEQVRKVLWEFGDLLFNNCQHGIKEDDIKIYSDWAIEDEATIELPSDEEIKEYSNRYSTMHEDVSDKLGKYLVSAIHIDGANWMREQILNQNK